MNDYHHGALEPGDRTTTAMNKPIIDARLLQPGDVVTHQFGDDGQQLVPSRQQIVERTGDDRGWWLDDGSWITDSALENGGTLHPRPDARPDAPPAPAIPPTHAPTSTTQRG